MHAPATQRPFGREDGACQKRAKCNSHSHCDTKLPRRDSGNGKGEQCGGDDIGGLIEAKLDRCFKTLCHGVEEVELYGRIACRRLQDEIEERGWRRENGKRREPFYNHTRW